MGPSTATTMWLDLLSSIIKWGQAIMPRGLQCTELMNFPSHIDMHYPVVRSPLRKLGYKFMPAEAYWILTGDNKVSTIAPYSKDIVNYSDDGFRFFGAYGPKVIGQLNYVVEALKRDINTRQAVMTIWRENPQETKDYPCTVALQFLVRGGKLNTIATMRSSDAWMGWPYDVFNFTMISAMVYLMVCEPNSPDDLGTLFMNVGSQHLYVKNEIDADKCISNIESIDEFFFDVNTFRSPIKGRSCDRLMVWLDERRKIGDLKTVLEV